MVMRVMLHPQAAAAAAVVIMAVGVVVRAMVDPGLIVGHVAAAAVLVSRIRLLLPGRH